MVALLARMSSSPVRVCARVVHNKLTCRDYVYD